MIARTEDFAIGEMVNGAMDEWIGFGGKAKGSKRRPMRDAAKRHDDVGDRRLLDFRLQKGPARVNFRSDRLVSRWYAANRVSDSAIDQLEAIIGAFVKPADGKTVANESRVKDVACVVTGKGAACPIGPAQSGREAHDQQSRVNRPK